MDNELSRRKMVALGTLGGGAALLGTGGSAAVAGPPVPGAAMIPFADPGGPRIGSPLIGGYKYVYCSWMDFNPYQSAMKENNGRGAYTTPSANLACAVDLPPGAVLRDIEWYMEVDYDTNIYAFVWTTGKLFGAVAHSSSFPAGANLRAFRTTVPATGNGPYATGAKLALVTNTSPTQVINGARVGFTMEPAGSVLLPAPVRVYDSRSGAKIGNGQTRIHSLASWIPAGASAAILHLSITSGEKTGGLAAYNTGSSLPSGSLLYWNGSSTVSNEVHVKLPSDRKIKVTSRGATGCKAHYFIDLVGYTA